MEHFAIQLGQDCFKISSTVVTSTAMESSFNQWLHQLACLPPCMVWYVETGMIHFSFGRVASCTSYRSSSQMIIIRAKFIVHFNCARIDNLFGCT